MGGARTLTLLAAVVLSLGCVTTRGERARQAQRSLVGAPLTTVTACLGQPHYTGDQKYGDVLAYIVPLGGSRSMNLEPLVRRGLQGPGSRNLPRGTGAAMRPSMGRSERTGRSDRPPARELAGGLPLGGCLLVFAVENGVVREVNAQGRTFDDMNGDAECAILLDHCERSRVADPNLR